MSNTSDIAALKKALTAETAARKAGDAALDAKVTALEGPTPPPTTGIPAIPAHDLYLRDFSDGTLGEFRPVTYLDAKPGDGMRYATDYAGQTARLIFPKDGGRAFLRQQCIAKSGNRWDGTFLSTGGGMGAPTFSFFRGYLEAAFRLPGIGPGTWQAPIWLRDDIGWTSRELDLYEFMEDMRGRYTLHGFGGDVQLGSLAPGDIATTWHRLGVAITDDHLTVTFDGKAVGRWTGRIDKPLNLLTDAKAGFPWQAGTPSAATPREFDTDLAWITATATIPAGL